MKTDDNDKLWQLLGKTRQPSVSPFFARNIVRAIRQEAPPRRGLFSRFGASLKRWTWQYALAGTCAIAALVTFHPSISFRRHQAAVIQSPSIESQIVANPDYEVINHLDELVADEESSVWLDDSVH
jgi:hypothetical protein